MTQTCEFQLTSKCDDVKTHRLLFDCGTLYTAACPANTEWVVVTNGDNDYASTFFSRIARVQGADLIAFDFYSRYHRATGASAGNSHIKPNHPIGVLSFVASNSTKLHMTAPCAARSDCQAQPHAMLVLAVDGFSTYPCGPAGMPCERFGQQEGAPTCKPNRLRWCHTDLGANVMRWPRLMAENRRFGFLAAL